MKKCFILGALFVAVGWCNITLAQQELNFKLPSAPVTSLNGAVVNTSSFTNNGNPVIIDFFATWCKPCVAELNAIADMYDYEKKRTGVTIIIISIDSATPASGKVANFIRSKGWKYAVYLDPQGIFQKAMNVMDTPATYIVNGKGMVVWVHNAYLEGDENELFKEVDKIAGVK